MVTILFCSRFFFGTCMCVVCACVFTCVWAHIYVLIFNFSPPYLLRQVSHLNGEPTSLASLAIQLAPGIRLSVSSTLGLQAGHHTHSAFKECWGSELRSSWWQTNNLPRAISPVLPSVYVCLPAFLLKNLS